jgi:hypothetical protein
MLLISKVKIFLKVCLESWYVQLSADVRARSLDRSRLTLRTNRSGLSGGVFNFCTTAGPWGRTVRGPNKGSASLHKSLRACADRLTGVDGPSTGAKMELGRDYVFLDGCTMDCLRCWPKL